MKNRRKENGGIVVGIVVSICLLILSCDVPSESKVSANGTFELKVNSLGPNDPLPFSPYAYSIQVRTSDGYSRLVKRWAQDDPWQLSMIDAEVLSDSVAYYFNAVDYGVTVDGGTTWQGFSYYSARRSWFGEFNTGGWPRVKIRADGTGELYEQNLHDLNGPKYVTFFTANFGQTWSVALRASPMWGEFKTKRYVRQYKNG